MFKLLTVPLCLSVSGEGAPVTFSLQRWGQSLIFFFKKINSLKYKIFIQMNSMHLVSYKLLYNVPL